MNRATGGPAVSVTRLAAAQARLGHEVTLAALDYRRHGPAEDPVPARLDLTEADFLAVHGRGWSPRFARRLEELARGVDVVHDHGLWMWPNKYARVAARKAGKPLVISPRGMLEDWSLRRAVVRKFVAWQLFERKNLESAALFHATADSEAEAIKTALRIKMKIKIKEPRIVVAPNGVDIPERIPNREALEARFAKLRGRRWILFMSRVHPKKGLLELAKAWMQIRESNPGWELVIAGPEQDKGYAEKLKREGGREVIWTGELRGEEKWAALGNAEFLVLPSHSENFGIVVAESLAAGRPVVTTVGTPWGRAKPEAGGRRSVVGGQRTEGRGRMAEGGIAGWNMNLEERKCGVICEVTDLKRGLEKMLGFSDKEREEMGARGREWMKEEFSWEAGAERLTSAYQELVG